ncbi:pre-mRNA-splicing factor CEF1-like isoform X2 [Hibiscus syriacus]|nr:pre-mRNA-splicing factor CEF1-like isoform X2 [Hibiscus syriacus]
MEKREPTYMTSTPLEEATGNDICERFQEHEQSGNISHVSIDNTEMQSVGLIQWDQSDVHELSTYKSSRFPKSAQLLFDAIKKNRSYQKLLRSKLTQIEVKIEENKKLKERVKILRDFQVSCKKITGRALSAKKDPRIQLISARKSRTSKDPEVNDKKVTSDYGPPDNSRVASYQMTLIEFPLRHQRKKWSREERENLEKGIRQQFQERALQVSVDWLSCSDWSPQDGNNLDSIIATVKDLEITPERIREFLPEVDWDQLASLYVKGRSGAECETRWLNHEDPLINHNPWTAEEDKNLLFIAQEKGIDNWLDIAVLLGSNRTPFQCLTRYQRSLNASILKREWTEEEDDQLRIAVEGFGECDWQSVASTLKGRTGTQCSNRWKKSLHPTRQRVGRWTREEDKRLKVAVMLFGPKNWRKIAEVVPGRTQVQCRERWVNSLDPALNVGTWTEEEDSRLEAAIEEQGYCWSKIATCMSSRTDNQCWRRWKTLHPEDVPLLREARKVRKAALISNFVDRESERPALGPNDFNIQLPIITATSESEDRNRPIKRKRRKNDQAASLPMIASTPEPENKNLLSKGKRKQRGSRPDSDKENAAAIRLPPKKRSHKSCRKGAEGGLVEVPGIIDENEVEAAGGHDSVRKIRRSAPVENNNCTEPAQDVTYQKKRKREPPSGNNNNTEPAHVAIQEKIRQPPSGHTNYSEQVQDDAVQTEKRKQQPESSKCIESVQDNSSSHPLSTLCRTTNHQVESFSRCLTIKRRKNRRGAPKQCSERSVNELHEEQYYICSENSVFSGADDGAEVVQSSSVDLENLGVEYAYRKRSSSNPRSKRKTSMALPTTQSSRIVEAKDSAKKNKKERRTRQQHSKSRKSNKQSGDEGGRTDEDHQTLACFLRNKSKKRRHETVENAQLSTLEEGSKVDDVLREADKLIEEDVTLACWRKQLKKRRVTVAQSGDMFK